MTLWNVENTRRLNVKCYLDGVDVTTRCVEADDREGYAVLLRLGDDGKPHGEPVFDRHDGRITVTVVAPSGLEFSMTPDSRK